MLANDEGSQPQSWSRFNECVSVIAWTSFLAACVETLVFFAFFDPMVLGIDEATPTWMALRPAAYAAGFFFFWVFTFVGSTLTAYMLGSSPNAPAKSTEPRP
jgi:hypothetical protein